MISYNSFLAEQNECVPVHTFKCQRGADSQPGAGVWNCSEGMAAECTTVRWQKRNGHYTEIANQLRGSVQGGLQAQPAGGLQPGAAQILTGSSAARNLQVGAERDRHLCHILQGKVSNNCRNQTQRRAIERSTREQFEALSEEFTHHRANQNSCCG